MDVVVIADIDVQKFTSYQTHSITCTQIIIPYGLAYLAIKLGLTFAGLHAFNPTVIHISVAKMSAVVVPSTARSAATDSSRFPENATIGAYQYRRVDA